MVPLYRAAKYLLLAYALALAAGWLFSERREDSTILIDLCLFAWQTGPVVLAAFCAWLSLTRGPAIWFLAVAVLVAASTAWCWYAGIYLHPARENRVALLLFLPFLQYGFVVAALIAALLDGWSARWNRPMGEGEGSS